MKGVNMARKNIYIVVQEPTRRSEVDKILRAFELKAEAERYFYGLLKRKRLTNFRIDTVMMEFAEVVDEKEKT